MVRPRRKERFARFIHRPVRVLGGLAVRAACGGNLKPAWSPLRVLWQDRAVGVVGSSNGAPSQTDGGANATLVGRTDGDPEPTRPHQSRASSARPVAEGSGQPRQNASTATQAAIRKEHCVIGGPDVESGDQTDSTRADNQPNAAPTQPSQRGSAPVPSSTAAAAAMRRSGLSPSSDPGTTG